MCIGNSSSIAPDLGVIGCGMGQNNFDYSGGYGGYNSYSDPSVFSQYPCSMGMGDVGAGMPFMGYGMGYGMNNMDPERAKQQMLNNYDMYTTRQGLYGKQQAIRLSNMERCRNISDLLEKNRPNRAMLEYDKLLEDMGNDPMYSTYSASQRKAVLLKQYEDTIGNRLVDDINRKTSSSFTQGLLMGIPILGLAVSPTSSDDFVEKVTGVSSLVDSKSSKMSGGLLTGGAIAVGIGKLIGKKSGVVAGVISLGLSLYSLMRGGSSNKVPDRA